MLIGEHVFVTVLKYFCLYQLQGEKASRNLEAVNYKNQIEQLKSSKKEREDKLLHSLREAEESHGNLMSVFSHKTFRFLVEVATLIMPIDY